MPAITPFPILQDRQGKHHHRHEDFTAVDALGAMLREVVRGDVQFDEGSRALYATDASNYRQVPIGVVLPLDVEDVEATISTCRHFGAPVLSRGGGTSLAGQCCNAAVVLDYSRYMDRVLEVDLTKCSARVQPGLVLDRLRDEAERFDLTFAPDPATHSRCTLGGMIGNNSCGVHALMGGKTVDNVESLDILLYDGTRMQVGPTSDEQLDAITAAGGRKGEIFAGLKHLRDVYATLVRERFPDIPRRVSGYNLDQLLPEKGFNVARALVGSEGTCVTVLEATCRLTHSPQHRRLVALGFSDAFVAADHVPQILAHQPIGLEGFDGLLIDFMLRKSLAVDDVALLPEGKGFLLCEFGADTADAADELALDFVRRTADFAERPAPALYTAEQAQRVWKVRESALGASVFVPGEKISWEGWEDSAVPPVHLGAYLRELFALMDVYGYRSPMYGHFGQGCVHLRISFDFTTGDGISAYRRFIDEAADLVLRYGGSFSGEHGDGQARAALLPKMFGRELMQAFVEFKRLWDPTNKMNPGKLIDPIAVYDPVENLRVGKPEESRGEKQWFTFSSDGGSFVAATSRCVGVGACRKQEGGTMCPSFMATRDEKHSTRGRAHLLWELLQRDVLKDRWQNQDVKEALDLCLSCKACKTECPVNVDMATWKAEFLAHHFESTSRPIQHYAFGFMDRWSRLASWAPSIANLPLRLPFADILMKRTLGIASERVLPRFAPKSFRRQFRASSRRTDATPSVLLWPDTWNNYFNPEALVSANLLLQASGHSVSVPEQHVCCGRPLYDFGFLDQARQYLQTILDKFEPEILAGIPFVMLEPSCASVFRDELLNFFPRDERAKRLSRQTLMLSEQLTRSRGTWKPPDYSGRRMVVHGHCHQKALLNMKQEIALLQETGAQVDLLDAGCCGMAGPFGFEADKFDISQRLAERSLLPAVRAADSEDILISNGFSCREQIKQNSTRRALHSAEVLRGFCQ